MAQITKNETSKQKYINAINDETIYSSAYLPASVKAYDSFVKNVNDHKKKNPKMTEQEIVCGMLNNLEKKGKLGQFLDTMGGAKGLEMAVEDVCGGSNKNLKEKDIKKISKETDNIMNNLPDKVQDELSSANLRSVERKNQWLGKDSERYKLNNLEKRTIKKVKRQRKAELEKMDPFDRYQMLLNSNQIVPYRNKEKSKASFKAISDHIRTDRITNGNAVQKK